MKNVRNQILSLTALALIVVANPLYGAERFGAIPLANLKLDGDGRLPALNFRSIGSAYVTVTGGEAYLYDGVNWRQRETQRLVVRADGDGPVRGQIHYRGDGSPLSFRLNQLTNDKSARKLFYRGKVAHYERLLQTDRAGSAWFRHQRHQAQQQLGVAANTPNQIGRAPFRRLNGGFDDTYDLFTGGRAISENLQLDRQFWRLDEGKRNLVPIANVNGVQTRAFDFKPLLKPDKIQVDPLATQIPHDQHVVFFKHFSGMIAAMDEINAHGALILSSVKMRTEDAESFKKYERQLCLPISQLSRTFGPAVIQSVALTGSDPYLPTGTDLAILLEARTTFIIESYLKVRRMQTLETVPDAHVVHGKIGEVAYAGVVTPDRTISTYTTTLGQTVVVTNSLLQLQRIVETHSGKIKSVATLDEYRFFRQRYDRTDQEETAFLMISDATIRRWCSPTWRIGASRRLRAGALLADLQAANMPQLVRGQVKVGPVTSDLAMPDGGTFKLTARGVHHSIYGTFGFLTPIRELNLEKITVGEREAYERWRMGYEQNWSGAFDPIAARFVVSEQKLGMDLTVIPLIAGSQYRQLINVVQGAQIKLGAGDRHDDELFRFSMAVDKNSSEFRSIKQWFGSSVAPTLKIDPLGWMGESVHLYVDKDKIWLEAMKSKRLERFIEKNIHRLPIAAQIEVSNGLKLAIFLAAVRVYVQESSPDLLIWETVRHNDMPYVRIRPSAQAVEDDPHLKHVTICYAATAKALVVSPSEPLMHRVLDRIAARRKAKAEAKNKAEGNDAKPATVAKAKPWPGKHLVLEFDSKFPEMLQSVIADQTFDQLRERSFSNLAILNEWKRRYPDMDPVAVHRKVWMTRLLCPAGGTYRWDPKRSSMVSTVFGHPFDESKQRLIAPIALQRMRNLSAGITFEHGGLRARVDLNRIPIKKVNPKP
jgi:hypothetical protein